MGKIMILNGSPRAPRSNSRRFAEIFSDSCRAETEYFNITSGNHRELAGRLEGCSDLLLVFPLYADGIPVTLLNFLKDLEKAGVSSRPVVSVLINCGFIEPEQNNTAVRMIKLYCRKNGYPEGSVLKIGSGEAILTTPFAFLVRRKIRKLASSVVSSRYRELQVTMPIPKKMFVRASSAYWENYGRRNGITREEMARMKIEE